MRILYVCSDFGVPVFGHKGASIHLRAMARALADLGHELCIVSPSCEREANLDFDLPVRSLPLPAAHASCIAELRRTDKRLATLPSGHAARVGYEVRNLLYNETLAGSAEMWRDLAPELVYERYSLYGYGGLELARALGVPHLLEVNAPLCLEQAQARGLHLADVAAEIERRVWCETDAFLGVSSELCARAEELGAEAARLHVMPNGVDAARFVAATGAAERIRTELALGAGLVIGFVGSLKAWHGTDVLLAAFARLAARWPEARLLVVGDGPMAASLRADAERLGIAAAVRFTGAVEHARIPDLLAAMDIAAAPYLPSPDFYFSPIKVYEYLAAGKAVIASELGQITELVAAGLVLPAIPGDAASLACQLEAVLAEPERAAQLAARGREWTLANRTWSANARRVLELAGACRARARA